MPTTPSFRPSHWLMGALALVVPAAGLAVDVATSDPRPSASTFVDPGAAAVSAGADDRAASAVHEASNGAQVPAGSSPPGPALAGPVVVQAADERLVGSLGREDSSDDATNVGDNVVPVLRSAIEGGLAETPPAAKVTSAMTSTTLPAPTPTTAAPTTSTTSPGLSWSTVFDGFGWVRSGASAVVAMAPMPSTRPSETHAGLVRSKSAHTDFDLSMQMRTVRQLRSGSPPNPWEVAWAVWNYADNEHFSYLILKPNGWELGKADPAYPGAQRFLATGETPFPIGPAYLVRIRQEGNVVTLWADGRQLVSFRDDERPYTSGSFGLYTEDAEVEFDAITVVDL